MIGLRYAKVEVDAFTEHGDPVLTLNVEEQETTACTGSAGIEAARRRSRWAGSRSGPIARPRSSRSSPATRRTVRYALTAAPTIVNQWILPGATRRLYGRITGGVNFDLTGAFACSSARRPRSATTGNEVGGFARVLRI